MVHDVVREYAEVLWTLDRSPRVVQLAQSEQFTIKVLWEGMHPRLQFFRDKGLEYPAESIFRSFVLEACRLINQRHDPDLCEGPKKDKTLLRITKFLFSGECPSLIGFYDGVANFVQDGSLIAGRDVGAPTPVNSNGYSIAVTSSSRKNGFRDGRVAIRTAPAPRPFIPTTEVIPRPEITSFPSSSTKQGTSISPILNVPL